MSADQGPMATPVIARSDPYAEIESFSQSSIAEDTHKWCAVMPWDFPQANTKEAEDEFLLRFFSDHEVHMHSARFLAHVWKCIALYNAQFRIPAMVEKWIEDNTEIWRHPNVTKHIFKEDAQPGVVFSEPELNTYPDAFLRVAVKGIQTRLKDMDLPSNAAEAPESAPAVDTAAVDSSNTEISLLPNAGSSSTIKPAAPTHVEATTFTGPHQNLVDGIMQQQVPAMQPPPNPSFSRPNGARHGAYAQPEHRPLSHKKPRGGHNTKRSSFGAHHGPGPLPPPGFENSRQLSNPFSHPYGASIALNAVNGPPYMLPGRVSSGGQQSGGEEQTVPPHLQFHQSQVPPSTTYMPPFPPSNTPRYSIEHGMPGSARLYDPERYGNHMQNHSSRPGPQQELPLMVDRTNLQGNAPSFSYQAPTHGGDGRDPKRRDSVASRGGKRAYGGSIRGRGSRGGRDSVSYTGNHESKTISDNKPRWIMQRDKPLDEIRRSSLNENMPLPSQDARNSIVKMPKAFENLSSTSSGNHGSFGVPRQTHEKAAYPQALCSTTCTKNDIAADCTTGTKLIVFDSRNDIPDTEIRDYFSRFGTVSYIGRLKSQSPEATHCNIWITFATVAEARKCLTARGQFWPFGQRDYLQVENAKQHWDASHRLHQPHHSQYAPPAPSFVADNATQTATDLSNLPLHQGLVSDAPPVDSVALDGIALMLSQDTSPAASGTTTPKKKAKANRKKKPKKSELLAEATAKVLAEAESGSERKSPDDDKAPSMLDSKVSVVSEGHDSCDNKPPKDRDDTAEHAETGATKSDELSADDSYHPNVCSPQPVDGSTLLNDRAYSSYTPAAPTTIEGFEDLPAADETGKMEPESYEHILVSNEKESEAMISGPTTTDVSTVQQHYEATGLEDSPETPKASVQFPSSLKGSKKAPIPKVPGSKAIPVVLPDLDVKSTTPAANEPANQYEHKGPDMKNDEADKISVPQQHSTSVGSGATTGYITALDMPAVDNAPTSSTEDVVLHVSSVAEEPKSMKSSKPKGPGQTESLSVFSSKAKKDKRKVSKSTKAKGSIKGKPTTADEFTGASQDTSGVNSGAGTPVPQEQPMQSTDAVQATVLRGLIDAPHPERCIHEPSVVNATVADGEEVTAPPAVTDRPPRPVRRGTFDTIFSYIRGGSQGNTSVTTGSQAESKREEKAETEKSTADDGATALSISELAGNYIQAQANSSESVGLGISNDITNGQLKSKKKKIKSRGKKEAQADVTATEPKQTRMTATEPLFKYSGNEAQPEGASSATDNSAPTGSPSGGTTRVLSKEEYIVKPKPLRKTHKRVASSRLSSDDSTDQSSAVAISHRRSSKEVSATQAAQRPRSPPLTILLVSVPPTDPDQVVEHLLGQDRVEDVTDVNEIDISDSKIFDSNGKADANDRVSPEVEEMRARMNELQQKEQKVKQSKGTEKAEAQ
ncbi:hypothetical protein DOTSEDRAFT_77159 [Dothistroma septosporum NZE10]|uniref:RRM domain-containing protein n=1 Tax=Dothistroma septosporum (strain NZE10 / CBS 128990) TaxID=675120 RepID=N1Q460_DOTSN|nr:hypothetical protein DOTSEDRAFT_77159 [Dothistroma septosporum NZE10]